MTGISDFAHGNHHLAVRAKWNGRIELASLANLAFSLLLALPLALLWESGPSFVFGVVYAVVYVGLGALPTALYVLMMFDAARVILGQPAGFMPVLIAMGRRGRKVPVSRSHPRLSALMRLGVEANPFSSLTRELWIFAFRFNQKAFSEMDTAASRIEVELNHIGMPQQLVAAELKEISQHRATLELVTC